MRAALLSAYGPPENLQISQVPEPALERPDDVRVAVHAAAVNPIDWKLRSGGQRGAIRYRLPWILGLDVSGVVLEVGPGVTRFSPGDAVFGCPDYRRPGSYAEQCVLTEGCLAPKPAALSHVEAASLPLVGLTAWQCLLPRIARDEQQSESQRSERLRVFIQAGSGGVGTFAIQLAKHHGAWVATTCSPRNHDLVRRLGADRVIDYRTQRWWEELDDLDVILDALGGEERERALQAVKRGGRVASIVTGLPVNTKRYGPNLGVLATGLGVVGFGLRGLLRGVQASTVVKRNHADQLCAIGALVEARAIVPVIERTFALDEVAAAHALGETGRIRGKVVITVR